MTKLLVVSDSCSLILVTKAKLLDIVCDEFKVFVPEKVFDEVVIAGKKLNKLDAFVVDEKVNMKKISVKSITKKNKKIEQFNLGKGEEEAILLALQENSDLLIIDDKQAINTARFIGIEWISVPVLIQGFYERKKLSKGEALDALSIVQREGRYGMDFILGVLKSIEGGIK